MENSEASFLIEQEADYLARRNISFRDFSAEQVQSELASKGIRNLHDYLLFQNPPKSGEPLSADGNINYEIMVNDRYVSQGFKMVKSTSLVGGFIYKK
jgi:hypothetical protein